MRRGKRGWAEVFKKRLVIHLISRKVRERLEEERRSREELCGGLEKENEELRTKLRDATNEVRGRVALPRLHVYHSGVQSWQRSLCAQVGRLESAMKQRDKREKAATEAASSSGANCSRLEDELQQTRGQLARVQEEAERQRDRQQREITSLRADKHRLEEKVLEQSRLSAERSLLDQSQRHTEEQMRSASNALAIITVASLLKYYRKSDTKQQLCDSNKRLVKKLQRTSICCTSLGLLIAKYCMIDLNESKRSGSNTEAGSEKWVLHVG